MHSIGIDPKNMQQEQKNANFKIHDWTAMH